MPINLTLQEQETHLNMTADDRGTWYCYTDDPVMIRRLDSIGADLTKREAHGGCHYVLRADQLLLRKGKRQVSEAQRQAAGERMRQMHAQTSKHTAE